MAKEQDGKNPQSWLLHQLVKGTGLLILFIAGLGFPGGKW